MKRQTWPLDLVVLSLLLASTPGCEAGKECPAIALTNPGRVLYSMQVLNQHRLLLTSPSWSASVQAMCPSVPEDSRTGVTCDAKGFEITSDRYVPTAFDVTIRVGEEDNVGTATAHFPADDVYHCDGYDPNARTITVTLE